jgi:hypothetical protein
MGIGAGLGAAIGGVAAGVGGVASSLIGGNKAAGGSQQSQYLQALEMNQNIANTAPFIGAGQYAVGNLQNALQSGRFGTPMDLSGMPTAAQVPTAPGPFVWNPTMEGLAQTPGYQFTLDQGLRATQSSAAARGLGMSGAAMRGAADYAGGVASNTYNQQLTNALNIYGAGLSRYDKQLAGFGQQAGAFQNQFNDYWANQTNPYNQLKDLATLGANSAAGQATSGTTAAQNIGNAAQVGAAQQGVGIAQAGNALAGTLNSAGVQNLLTGSGAGANNRSVTGGGIFNTFSGLGPYAGGYGSYYSPPSGSFSTSGDPNFAPGAAPATQYYNPIGWAQS